MVLCLFDIHIVVLLCCTNHLNESRISKNQWMEEKVTNRRTIIEETSQNWFGSLDLKRFHENWISRSTWFNWYNITHVLLTEVNIDVEIGYVNHNGFNSMNTQLICDYDMNITLSRFNPRCIHLAKLEATIVQLKRAYREDDHKKKK